MPLICGPGRWVTCRFGRMSTATLHTTKGDIVIELFDDEAPNTVANFVGLAGGTKEYRDATTGETKTGKFYDGLGFHRVIDGFMIQGGCPLGTGTGGPGYRFADEFHPEHSFNRPYLLAMANAGPALMGRSFSSPSHPPRTSTVVTPSSGRSRTRPARPSWMPLPPRRRITATARPLPS